MAAGSGSSPSRETDGARSAADRRDPERRLLLREALEDELVDEPWREVSTTSSRSAGSEVAALRVLRRDGRTADGLLLAGLITMSVPLIVISALARRSSGM